MKHTPQKRKAKPLWPWVLLTAVLLLPACHQAPPVEVDLLNETAYAWHYRNIDSTEHYAQQALKAAADYADGRAEALNHLAFARLVRMDYDGAQRLLDTIPLTTDNHLELLVASVQQMRLCQRRSRNRDFYLHREQAMQSLQRINEERASLDPRQEARLLYAETEMAIVTSTYYYYVGLERQSAETMLAITPDVAKDTAQWLNYLYNVGAGGTIDADTQEEVNQREFDHLMRCFLLARQGGYPFFVANSLEALAEHIIEPAWREKLVADDLPAMKYLNPQALAYDKLPLWLAEEALAIFQDYGDTYQTAGAYRTMASCHLATGDAERALTCLDLALADTLIMQAPDLVASICEQMSVAYAAIDEKPLSDYNRNRYLDLQEQTRQDRQLEARAEQLEASLRQFNALLWAVALILGLVMVMLALLYWRKRTQRRRAAMLPPEDSDEELEEQLALARLNVEKNERRHLEQRAKVSLVCGITPLIDRMLYTIDHARRSDGNGQWSTDYVQELTDEISRQNEVLTHWIQLRQGEVSLHIETFPLNDLFNMVGKSQMGFSLKGITLNVVPTTALVKADRVLTLFMVNTLADNARKFTPAGGTVTIDANETDDYVEVAVSDTGIGMTAEQLTAALSTSAAQLSIVNCQSSTANTHGFGLMNCKGIIEKYRKMSHIFDVCLLSAESTVGKGSRFYFRLPRGVAKGGTGRNAAGAAIGMAALLSLTPTLGAQAQADSHLARASIFADSAYFSNINGTYERTLVFADSCRSHLNSHYRQQRPEGNDTLVALGDPSVTLPEVGWYYDSLQTNYSIILDIRNESAVAALALHQWQLYHYNNRIYTRLLKELSADGTLADYCRRMQQSQANRQVAIILLVVLIAAIVIALLWQLLLNVRRQARRQQERQEQLELKGDELHRLQQEENAVYVSNAVLDNTLSTLKHETMYYPSRIRQMLLTASDYGTVREVVAYYRELYAMLSMQSTQQTSQARLHLQPLAHDILGDDNLVRYLFDIIRKESGQQQPAIAYDARDEKYIVCTVTLPTLHRTNLFTPDSTDNIPWLLCRQIVRDHGEATNRRACAITAENAPEGGTRIVITLPRVKRSH